MRTYKVLEYTVIPDPKYPNIGILSSYYATIEETSTFLFFTSKNTYEVFKTGMFWRYKESGLFTSLAFDRFIEAYEAYRD